MIELSDYLGVAGEAVRVVQHGGAAIAPALPRIAAVAPWLEVEHEPDAASVVRTTLSGSRPHGDIEFVGPIEGRQLEPLVETLRALSTGQVESDTPATGSLLGSLACSVEVTVVVSPGCPYCPAVTAAALRLALLSPQVHVRVVRADSAAAPPDIRAVPTVVVDGHAVVTGPVGEYALAEKLGGESRR